MIFSCSLVQVVLSFLKTVVTPRTCAWGQNSTSYNSYRSRFISPGVHVWRLFGEESSCARVASSFLWLSLSTCLSSLLCSLLVHSSVLHFHPAISVSLVIFFFLLFAPFCLGPSLLWPQDVQYLDTGASQVLWTSTCRHFLDFCVCEHICFWLIL